MQNNKKLGRRDEYCKFPDIFPRLYGSMSWINLFLLTMPIDINSNPKAPINL